MTTTKRILDYGYYCDLVETNEGNLRIDINDEGIEKMKHDFANENWDEEKLIQIDSALNK